MRVVAQTDLLAKGRVYSVSSISFYASGKGTVSVQLSS